MGASVGASVGSVLVPGFGLVGSGAGGISSGGASAPPLACLAGLSVLPSDLLVLHLPPVWLHHRISAIPGCPQCPRLGRPRTAPQVWC